jgi:hypothetical protein
LDAFARLVRALRGVAAAVAAAAVAPVALVVRLRGVVVAGVPSVALAAVAAVPARPLPLAVRARVVRPVGAAGAATLAASPCTEAPTPTSTGRGDCLTIRCAMVMALPLAGSGVRSCRRSRVSHVRAERAWSRCCPAAMTQP